MPGVIEIRHYVTRTGQDLFDQWFAGLPDARAQAKIATRIDRLSAGNFGDCKSLRRGLCELRIDWGPGYRVYYAMLGRVCVLLLAAARNESNRRISSALSDVSTTTRRGSEHHETQIERLA